MFMLSRKAAAKICNELHCIKKTIGNELLHNNLENIMANPFM